ncbi:MAG: DUF2785 domain-containing protein [Lutisporaceae bacterium]
MGEVNQLKEQLQAIKDNDWKLPEGMDIYALALKAIDNIGATDPVLRDGLILEYLIILITQKLLNKEQIKVLLNSCLSEKHLFYKLGETEDDSVFNRTFSLLVVDVILYYHINLGEELLTKDEFSKVFGEVVKYVRTEKDVRGYVKDKGWAHAMAHSGDALGSLALCNEINHYQLQEILEVIKGKMNITYYVYKNEEAERLTSAILNVIRRNILGEEEIINWIKSFDKLEMPKDLPYSQYWKENIKNLLRSLYFRLKFKKEAEIFIEALEEVQNNINSIYNNLEA